MHDDLGIGMGAEAMPLPGELFHQLLEIVDLAVEGDRDRVVLVEQGLLAAGDVDDGEPAMAEADAGREMEAAAVRAAMGDAVGHAAKQIRIDRASPRAVHDAGNSTHPTSPFLPA